MATSSCPCRLRTCLLMTVELPPGVCRNIPYIQTGSTDCHNTWPRPLPLFPCFIFITVRQVKALSFPSGFSMFFIHCIFLLSQLFTETVYSDKNKDRVETCPFICLIFPTRLRYHRKSFLCHPQKESRVCLRDKDNKSVYDLHLQGYHRH